MNPAIIDLLLYIGVGASIALHTLPELAEDAKPKVVCAVIICLWPVFFVAVALLCGLRQGEWNDK